MKKKIYLLLIITLAFFMVCCGNQQTYKISYSLKGGTLTEKVEEFKHNDDVTLPIPSKEGYDFVGWYEGDQLVTELENKDYNLTAKWELKTFTIEYDLAGGEFSKEPQTEYKYGDKVFLPEPTKEGYAFMGWYEGDKYVTVAKDKDYKLVATWSVYPFTISYDFDGGNYDGELVSEYLKYQEVILPNPTKEGFFFAGWYQNEQKITKIDMGCYELKAKWIKDEGQFANLTFESKEVTYDGKEHSLEVT